MNREPSKQWRIAIPVTILIVAGVLRVVFLDNIPAGFFRDEADKGYGAFCLLETGADVQGRHLPLFISSLAIYTTALYQYALVPFIRCWGLNEFTVRLPAAVFGTLTVGAIFLLGRRWMGFWQGTLASLLLAVSPWHLPFSRWANQGIMLPLLLTLFMLARDASRRQKAWLVGAVLALFGALYSYEPAKAIVPVLLLGLIVYDLLRRDSSDLNNDLLVLGLLLLSAIPMIRFHLTHPDMSNARFQSISVLTDFFQHPVRSVFRVFLNYLAHFSPAYLFISGDANPRHSVASMGQLYLTEVISLAVASWVVIRERRREDILCVIWLAAAIVPAALTNEGVPHALRTIGAVPAFALLSARGLSIIIGRVSNTGVGSLLGKGSITVLAATVFLIGLFFVDYYGHYAVYSAPDWEYGWRESVERIQIEKAMRPNVVISGWASYPEIFILFYTQHPPDPLGSAPSKEFFFLPFKSNAEEYISRFPKPALFLGRPNELPGFRALEIICYPDGVPAWKIYAID